MIKQIWTALAADIRTMSGREHFWYWIFPFVLLSTLIVLFFSGVPALVELINPRLNKEWGVLENIQLAIVAVIICVAVYAFFAKKPCLQKLGFGLVSAFALFVFLEEIDYGAHFAEYLTGARKSQLARFTGVYNIHNYTPSAAAIIKRSVYVVMLLVFVIAPFVRGYFRNELILYLIPRPRIVIVAALTVLCEVTARALIPLNNMRLDELTMDIGEFSEILVYYIFLVYLWQLIFEKEWVAANVVRPR